MRRVALLLLVASCASPAQPADQRAQPIVNGTVDTGDPAVVSLTYLGQSFCTGTLVSPRVVVTAAHCIDPAVTGGVPVDDLDVFIGTNTMAGGTTIHLVDGRMHPGWDLDSLANDIACVELAGPASVDPVKMNRMPLAAGHIGDPIRLVGFGSTSSDMMGGGVKRQALSMVLGVNETTITYGDTPGQTCFGDSGGPGFMTMPDGVEYFAGVTSAGDEECAVFGIDTRVDAYIESFIQPCIDAAGPTECGADGVCTGGCIPPDPDCPVDECGPGNTCKLDCPSRDPDCFCVNGDGYCDLGCTEPDVDCTGDIPMGQRCGDDRDCQLGICIHAVDDLDFRYCSRQCTSEGDCAGGGINGAPMPCTQTTIPDFKVCAYEAPSPGVTGASCNSGADCWSGLCVPSQGGRCPEGSVCSICSRGCLAELGGDCAFGYTCQTTTVGADELHVCLPAPPMSGWCSAAPGAPGTGAAVVLILAALAAILRRKSE